MCQYCGCHEITTIGELMDDHVEIRNLTGRIEAAVRDDEREEAVRLLRELERRFGVHNTVEEAGLYLAMTRFPEHEDKAATLYDEHDALDAVIDDILATQEQGRLDAVDFCPLLREFDILVAHIDHEENGLFPAAAVALDSDDWDRCENLRVDALARLDRPLWSEQGAPAWSLQRSTGTRAPGPDRAYAHGHPDHEHPHEHAHPHDHAH